MAGNGSSRDSHRVMVRAMPEAAIRDAIRPPAPSGGDAVFASFFRGEPRGASAITLVARGLLVALVLAPGCARARTDPARPSTGNGSTSETAAAASMQTPPPVPPVPPVAAPSPSPSPGPRDAAPPNPHTITWWRDRDCPVGTTFASDRLSGTDKYWCVNARSEKEGPWVQVHQDRVVATCPYQSNKPHGRCLEWTEGRLTRDVSYERGVFHGPHVIRTVTGEKWKDFHFAHGQPHGVQTVWFDAHQKSSENEYVDGNMHGRARSWYRNGRLEYDAQMLDDYQTGLWTWLHENGTKKREGRFGEGREEGAWRTWTADGKLSEVAVYEFGQLQKTTFYRDGVPVETCAGTDDDPRESCQPVLP
jgi:hypothetical protein